MGNPYFDPSLHALCRESMRNFLRLYFEFGFKDAEESSPEFVAEANDIYAEILDDQIDDDRLLAIYLNCIKGVAENPTGLLSFALLPTLFLRDDLEFPDHE